MVREYVNRAIDIVIDVAAEQGIKYRRGDFVVLELDENNYSGINTVRLIGGAGSLSGITVSLVYDFPRAGKKLKAGKDKFLPYKYCRVKQEEILFTFCLEDLERFKAGMESGQGEVMGVAREVQALFAGERGIAEEQALSACVMAQEILIKWFDLVWFENFANELESVIVDTGSRKKWQFNLSLIVAKGFFCKQSVSKRNEIIFWGCSCNALVARIVFFYLFKIGDYLAMQYVRSFREKGIRDTSRLYNGFCDSFCTRLEAELEKRHCIMAPPILQEVLSAPEAYSDDSSKDDSSEDCGNAAEAEILSRLAEAAAISGVDLTYMQKVFFLRLLDYAEKYGESIQGGLAVYLSVADLSKTLDVPARTVSYSLKSLTSCGALSRTGGEQSFPRNPSVTIINRQIYERKKENESDDRY